MDTHGAKIVEIMWIEMKTWERETYWLKERGHARVVKCSPIVVYVCCHSNDRYVKIVYEDFLWLLHVSTTSKYFRIRK